MTHTERASAAFITARDARDAAMSALEATTDAHATARIAAESLPVDASDKAILAAKNALVVAIERERVAHTQLRAAENRLATATYELDRAAEVDGRAEVDAMVAAMREPARRIGKLQEEINAIWLAMQPAWEQYVTASGVRGQASTNYESPDESRPTDLDSLVRSTARLDGNFVPRREDTTPSGLAATALQAMRDRLYQPSTNWELQASDQPSSVHEINLDDWALNHAPTAAPTSESPFIYEGEYEQ